MRIYLTTYPCIHPCIRPCIHASVHPYMHPYMDPCIHPWIHASIHPSIQPAVCSCIRHIPSIHESIHSCIYSFIAICNQATTFGCSPRLPVSPRLTGRGMASNMCTVSSFPRIVAARPLNSFLPDDHPASEHRPTRYPIGTRPLHPRKWCYQGNGRSAWEEIVRTRSLHR